MTISGVETESQEQSPPPTASKASVRIAIAVVAVLGLAGAGLIGVRVKQANEKRDALGAQREAAAASAALKAPLSIVAPVATTWKPRVEITGTLQPWRSADVGFEQGGRLARVLVATGDTVKDGQALAFLDSAIAGAQISQAEAQARAAEANLALAEDNLGRTQALIASKSIPDAQAVAAKQQVELAKAQLEGARASERLARTGAGQRSIGAPFAGLVTKAPTSAGGVVAPGAPLIHLEDHSHFRLSATIGEEIADLVKPGLTVDVKYRDRSVSGRVATVIPSLDQATRRAPIEIEVQNDPKDPLLAWSFVHASIDSGKEVPAMRVPGSARRPGSTDQIVVVRDGKILFLHVAAATDSDGALLVREGLTTADQVVLAPTADLREGDTATTRATGN